MALAQKFRPAELSDVIGNEETVRALGAVLSKPRADIQHAFLFIGPPGCGKTTLGRITANRLDCHGMDLNEVDSADFRGIDTIREIRRNMTLAPFESTCRVWLLDECHAMTNDAQTALLKALEDAPSHVYFILCTTDPQKLLPTILSRCATFEVQALGPKTIQAFLQTVSRSERKRVPAEVLERIAADCLGSCRNALQILDKVIDLDPADMLVMAEQTAAKDNQVIDLCRAVMQRAKWNDVAKILKGLEKENPEKIRLAILGYCSNILLSGKDAPQAFVVMDCFREPLYTNGRAGLILAAYEALESVK